MIGTVCLKRERRQTLTGMTFTLYLVIFGSATLPWLATCKKKHRSQITTIHISIE